MPATGDPMLRRRDRDRDARGLAALDDAELVTRAKAGGRDALDALLQRHFDLVYAVCRRITGSDADAADASQDAMVAIVRGLARFDGSAAFTTWAYRIATNASLDELRRRRRRPEPAELIETDRGSSGTPLGTTHTRPVDEQVAVGIDVDRALAGLPPDYRAAVVLRDLCGLDYAEIAEILGIPGGTVRSRIARGRAALVPLVGGNQAQGGARPRTDHA